MKIQRLNSETASEYLPKLVVLLQDAVTSGASLGFLPPLPYAAAVDYWQEVVTALQSPYRILLVALLDGEVVGTVQLDMASRANAGHRAEVCKLMVHTTYRGHGVAQALMNAIEQEARSAGRTTLILDTRAADPSERLYTKLGYARAGIIPEYARSADGSLHSTVYMYKLLK